MVNDFYSTAYGVAEQKFCFQSRRFIETRQQFNKILTFLAWLQNCKYKRQRLLKNKPVAACSPRNWHPNSLNSN